MRLVFSAVVVAALTAASPAAASPAEVLVKCGGSFAGFVDRMKKEARANGHQKAVVDRFFAGVKQDPGTLKADRAQGIFQKPFIEFSRSLISKNRMQVGQAKLRKYARVFDRLERDYGINRGVLTAFWAFETDYGAFQGNFNTLNSLMTLSHDCRRPELFQPQVMSALTLYEHGDFDPRASLGAWAGEIGMVQMLPGDILASGVDGDGNGHVDLRRSVPDALLSGGNMLHGLGWRAHEPWIQEVVLPADFDWSKTGLETEKRAKEWAKLGVKPRQGALAGTLPASILLPQGRKGPAFLAYPNFRVYFEWNQSFTYVMTAAYFATRLEGAPVYLAGNPDPALSGAQVTKLQKKLAARGYDVGEIDGILGAKTRIAVQKEQIRLGLPADAWPTSELLSRL